MLEEHIAALHAGGELALPFPGQGETPCRHRSLMRWGQQDLSLARIAEAHTDALAILAEAGGSSRPGKLYGVWASDGPQGALHAEHLTNGNWRLQGMKQFCSGATFLQSALVTAHAGDEVRLFDVPLDDRHIEPQPSRWKNPALADTETVAVEFLGTEVDASKANRRP